MRGVNVAGKSNRGVNINSSNPNPGFGTDVAYDSSAEKNRQSAVDALTRLAGVTDLPPAVYGTSTAYVADPNTPARNRVGGAWTDRLTGNPPATGILADDLFQTDGRAIDARTGQVMQQGVPAVQNPAPMAGGAPAQAAEQPTGLLGLIQSLLGNSPIAKIGNALSGPEGMLAGMVKERPANMVMGEDVRTPDEISGRSGALTSGQKRLTGNIRDTLSKRQSELNSGGSFSTKRSGTLTPGQKVRTSSGVIKTVQKDGTFK